jgi:hypothetical protein
MRGATGVEQMLHNGYGAMTLFALVPYPHVFAHG